MAAYGIEASSLTLHSFFDIVHLKILRDSGGTSTFGGADDGSHLCGWACKTLNAMLQYLTIHLQWQSSARSRQAVELLCC
jgi:hypothetical protein